jgi:3,4-dihydroxy 2-butanone 4-phosphate synthase/GTP cyclohydrolase II
VFGSARCDCGEQLRAALALIAREGRGLLLYLRQEGRGIGLANKVRAYASQDRGLDTVEANLHLGFPADGRSYADAAAMLKDQGVQAVRLLTNNPQKVRGLEACGVRVVERVRFQVRPGAENHHYLRTKASKLGHLLQPWPAPDETPAPFVEAPVPRDGGAVVGHLRDRLRHAALRRPRGRAPHVTLTYAQSLDGSITAERGKPFPLSNLESQTLTHQLRALHDAVLVGLNTVLVDDPRLTVRLVAGKNPRPVVLDSRLRFPLGARLLRPPCVAPLIATTAAACPAREARLREAGAEVLRLPARRDGRVSLRALLGQLDALGYRSLMVEGGSRVITGFLASRLADLLILTIAPQVVGGLPAVKPFSGKVLALAGGALRNVQYHSFAGDVVVCADLEKPVTPPKAGPRPAQAPGGEVADR